MIKVALDAMGGDNAPGEIVKGAVDAVNTSKECFVYLVGKEDVVNNELSKYTYSKEQIEVVNATEVIETGEPPVMAIRHKKDSSLVKALNMVKNKEADAFVSAGSSGAILVGGQVIVGRLPGVERPPIGAIVPTDKGCVLIVDSGANVDARPAFLVQWAKMGSIYMENCLGIKKPRVAIVNVGLEEEKGNQLVKETFPLLKACDDINFIGSIEAREIPRSGADVIVCDAFVGNVILKLYEGLAGTIISKIKGAFYSNLKSKIGAMLVKDSIKSTLKTMDASEYGGAPLIGLNGLVAIMFPGVLPNILLASFPTASTSPVSLSTATTDGSLKTIPFPLTYAITVAVPKSIPISCPNPNLNFFFIFFSQLSLFPSRYKCITIILHNVHFINPFD